MDINSYEFDPPLVPVLALGWLIAVGILAEFRLLHWDSLSATSYAAFFVLACFCFGILSFLGQRLIFGQYKIAIADILVLIAFISVALTNLAIFVLACFCFCILSFLGQRLVFGQYKIAIADILVLIAFISVALPNLAISVAVGALGLAVDAYWLKRKTKNDNALPVLVEKIGAVLGSIYVGASFARFLAPY